MTTPELYQFANALTDFKKTSLAKGLSQIYNTQLSKVYSQGDDVEAILMARHQ